MFLVAALVLVFFIPASADAASVNKNTGSNVIRTYLGSEVSSDLCTALKGIDVNVDKNTLFQVLPLEKNKNGSVLAVTNVDGATVTTEYILSIGSGGMINNLSASVIENGASTRAGGGAWLPYFDGTLVRAVAVYNVPSGSSYYVQPTNCYFIYRTNGVETITYVFVDYICCGYEFTYPGMVDLTVDDLELYYHNIWVEKTNPVNGAMYMSTNEYRTDRVICTTGNPGAGQYFAFTIFIDGLDEPIVDSCRVFEN